MPKTKAVEKDRICAVGSGRPNVVCGMRPGHPGDHWFPEGLPYTIDLEYDDEGEGYLVGYITKDHADQLDKMFAEHNDSRG